MGNAPSVETDAAQLKEELAEMHRSLQALSVRCSPPPVLLRDQFLVDNVIVDTRKDVQVLLGPVVGKIEFQRARVLLEVDRHARVTAFVSTFDAVTNTMVELPQLRCAVQCQANQPTAFVIERLVPGKRYSVTFGGIKSEDVAAKRCNFRTQTLEHGNKLSIVVVSGDNVYDLESGERNLWKDVRKRVEQEEAPTVLHLGGQVAMKRMFDQAVQLLVLYANGFSGDRADRMDWPTMEAKATEILRSAYRSQWTLSPDLQFVLANACNLMMWSDGDIYPQFSTRDEFFIDHEQPTLRMQVIRTVTRCARRLFHEYQRQLWDNNMKQLIEYEMQLCEVSEKALASMGQIFTITHKIPNVTDELAILKKRHDIDGARRVDKHLRALEAEKAKMEKQMISFNQLLAPQRGEEFLFEVGRIAVLVLDLRSSRLEPGGSQARENDLLSNLQWRFVEETLERSDIQLLVVCSEVPIIGDIQDGGSPTTAAAGVTETRWDANSTSQSRLLSQLFDWKLQQPNRQFVVLAGANEVRCYARMSIKDTKLRVNAEQYTVGAISAKAHAKMIPRRNGLLYDRFEFEHCEDISNVRCFLELKLESSQGAQSNVIEVCRGGQDKDGDNLAKVLLGPVVGWVDDSCAVVLVEVDRDAEIPCLVENTLTRETRRVFQRFYANQANSFFITHLRPGHYYQLSLGRIHRPEKFRSSFTTVPAFPRQFDVVALCNDSTCSGLDGSDKEPHLWHTIAEHTVETPFAGLNLTVHLGGQFFPESNDHIHAALQCAGNSTASSNRIFEPRTKDDPATPSIINKFREMYRARWNIPGVRESLANGAHLMLVNENDQLSLNNQDGEDQQNVSVRALLSKFHVLYQNLLLPPSKRLREGEFRWNKPLCHCFGAFGLFVLPVDEFGGTSIHEDTWLAFRSFLATPMLSRLLLISTEALIEESLGDIKEKATFDAAYRLKFGFYQQDVARLLDFLFDWQRQRPIDADIQRQAKRQIVLLSGSRYRSFDSVIREVFTAPAAPTAAFPNPPNPDSPVVIQYVVGPLQATVGSVKASTILSHGSLFGRYTYHHSFLRERLADVEKELPTLADTAMVGGTKRASEWKLSPPNNQLIHLLFATEADKSPSDDFALPTAGATRLYAKCCYISRNPIGSENSFDDGSRDDRIRYCHVDGSGNNAWKLETVLPAWLHEILAQPTTEAEEDQIKERVAYLRERDNDVQAAFQRSLALANGLVSLSNVKHCVAIVTESLEAAHHHGANVLRAKFPEAPSSFVVTFTLQQLRKPESAGQQQISSVGAIDFEQYVLIFQQSFVNAWLFSERLEHFWT